MCALSECSSSLISIKTEKQQKLKSKIILGCLLTERIDAVINYTPIRVNNNAKFINLMI